MSEAIEILNNQMQYLANNKRHDLADQCGLVIDYVLALQEVNDELKRDLQWREETELVR